MSRSLYDVAYQQDVEGFDATQKKSLVGDFDPLSGDADSGDMGGLVQTVQSLTSIMAEMLVELRTQRPLLPVVIDGATSLRANETNPYFFIISGKRVPSLNLLVQNNSASLVYYALSSPAGTGDFQLPSGSTLSINDAIVDFISFYSASAVTVRGVKNTTNPIGNGLVVQAWSNPEWSNVYGSI